jgi:hypothetical protein
MRSREEILSDLTFKKQFQGTLAQKAEIELLLDLRDLLSPAKKKEALVTGFKQS